MGKVIRLALDSDAVEGAALALLPAGPEREAESAASPTMPVRNHCRPWNV